MSTLRATKIRDVLLLGAALPLLAGLALMACSAQAAPDTPKSPYPPVVAKRKPFVAIGGVQLNGYQIMVVRSYGAEASYVCVSDGNCFIASGDASEIASLIAGQLP